MPLLPCTGTVGPGLPRRWAAGAGSLLQWGLTKKKAQRGRGEATGGERTELCLTHLQITDALPYPFLMAYLTEMANKTK